MNVFVPNFFSVQAYFIYSFKDVRAVSIATAKFVPSWSSHFNDFLRINSQ